MHPLVDETRDDDTSSRDGGGSSRRTKKLSKFLLCFGVVNMESTTSVVQPDDGGDKGGTLPTRCLGEDPPLITYVKVEGDKDGLVFPVLPLPEEEFVTRKKDKRRRSFSRVVKAVLFETSLAKKIKKKKQKQKLHQSSGNQSSPKAGKNSSPTKRHPGNQESGDSRIMSDSSLWSPSSVSCSSSSRSSTTTTNSFQLNQTEFRHIHDNGQDQPGKGYYSSNIGLCLLLISLLVLVFWGKLCSILCTSVWLFLVPRLHIKKHSSLQYAAGCGEIDSEEYKKRIIMGGLLERNRGGGRGI
ncbi:hypothetical protein Tsubulata_005385 [Turnera subulata]|uniref:Uncharacterized protein n=1 Tax=Turnera subulata TaxID=218843 RepID=A0A9Q0G6B7_9ROSI|nr:hypothetical protein Tsubulata_005385 [Turnera subulata]